MKVIGVIGTRRRDSTEDFLIVEKKFKELYRRGDSVCSGLCPKGADRFAVILSEKYRVKKIWYPADWNKYGIAAGFIRNTDIAKTSDTLIACVSKDRRDGTEDAISKFIAYHGSKNLHIV